MEAVIATGGKQYLVAPGQVITVEKLEGDKGAAVAFTSVLMVSRDGEVIVGPDRLKSAKVSARGAHAGPWAQGLDREVQAAEELSAPPRPPAVGHHGAHHHHRGLGQSWLTRRASAAPATAATPIPRCSG